MNKYDLECSRQFDLLRKYFEDYFVDVTVDCPYQLPHAATFHQALFAPMPDHVMELFLASGYRRNGNCLYAMRCSDCTACVPIRLHPQELQLNRNQRRVLKKNQDMEIEFGPVQASSENLALCQKFLTQRYPHKNNQAEGYYAGFFLNGITSSMEIRYRLGRRLLGCAVIDMGDNWLNAVYCYFDPDEAGRSLGTYNILTLAELCLHRQIQYLYLGYYIEQVAAMNYKRRFLPHYLYIDGGWQRVGRDTISREVNDA